MKPAVSIHQVYFNNAYLGSHLMDFKLPGQCYLLALVRDDKIFTLADNPTLLEQDWLVAVALNEALVPELDLYLRQTKLE